MRLKMAGRNFKLDSIPEKMWEVATMLRPSMAFVRPINLWRDYVLKSNSPWASYRMRDGTILHMSDNPHDVITMMVNFCKMEYGAIKPDSVVVDVGANIGMFSLYAARSGAHAIYSFEPNRAAFNVLEKNILENDLSEIVRPYNFAISGIPDSVLYLPRRSSPYNRAESSVENGSEFDAIPCRSLEYILESNDLDSVDYLKMDVEGAEFDILLQASDQVLKRIRRIRMELHYSRKHSRDAVLERCRSAGFSVVHQRELICWLDQKPSR